MQAGEKLPGNCVRATVTRDNRKQGDVCRTESDDAALNNAALAAYDVDSAARGRAAGGKEAGGSWVNFHYGSALDFVNN